MSNTNCRERAAECVELAQKVDSRSSRTMLLHIADVWLRLATSEAEAGHVSEDGAKTSLH